VEEAASAHASNGVRARLRHTHPSRLPLTSTLASVTPFGEREMREERETREKRGIKEGARGVFLAV
jgi:hypothetical protein